MCHTHVAPVLHPSFIGFLRSPAVTEKMYLDCFYGVFFQIRSGYAAANEWD
jgi:hypothetical protein